MWKLNAELDLYAIFDDLLSLSLRTGSDSEGADKQSGR